MNDPFEATIAVDYVVTDEEEENRQLAVFLTTINESRPVTPEHVSTARAEYGSLFRRELFTQQVSTRFGIVSFTDDPRHPLMWSHYTIDGSGFAIGYDVAELRKIARTARHITAVTYSKNVPAFMGPIGMVVDYSNVHQLLSFKSDHWSYENEWRLIVELNQTIGTGQTDQHTQPINLLRIPNEAVVSVHHTERTPSNCVELIQRRLQDANNRYRARKPRKLILSPNAYRYEESSD